MTVLLGLLASLWTAPVVAQTATHQVHLERGKNLVSLPLRPADARMEAVFGDALDHVEAVWGSDDRVYAPGYETDLTDWDWAQAYVVYADRAVSFTVSGQPIDETAPIPLQRGLNSVSFTRADPMPVEAAFAGLGGVLDYVEDGDGRRYPAAPGREVLYLLEPGQGYRVRLSGDATLVYPDGTAPPGFGDVNVNTIAEALALTGLQTGQTVGVAGYYRPGDGGGGLFEVRESGAGPDGGTVFVLEADQSDEIEEVRTFSKTIALTGLPPSEDVVFGSLHLTVTHRPTGRRIEIPGEHLHGHRYQSKWTQRSMFYYDGGTFFDSHAAIQRFLGGSNAAPGDLRFRYRRTTSDRRLHRLAIGATLNTHWFGIRPAQEGVMWTGTTDVQPLLAHVVNVAATMNAEAPGTIRDVLLPALATYDYFGSIELSDGLMLRGAAGTHLVSVTNDLGHTYRPVRVRPAHTRLRVMDGEALWHIRMEKDPSDPDYVARDLKHVLNTRRSTLSPADGVLAAGLADLVLDGNWEENRQAWTEGWASKAELETNCRNTPSWAGFVATDHGGKRIPQGQTLTLRNVAVLGYGSNGLLGNANATWNVTNLRAGNSLWNHVLYSANGTHENLTLVGFAWGHAAWGHGTVRNLVYENGQRAPERQGKDVFSIRGGDAYEPSELVGDGYFTREDGTVPDPIGTTVEGFYMDLRDSGLGAAFNGLGMNVVIRGESAEQPGIIVTNGGGQGVFHENGNGWQKAVYPGNRFSDIVIYDTGDGGRKWTFGGASLTGAALKNIRTERLRGENSVSQTSTVLRAGRRNHSAWDTPQTLLIEGLVETTPHQFIATVNVEPNASGMSVTIRDSEFANTTSTLFRGPNGQGTLAGFPNDPSKLDVRFENVVLNLPSSYFQNTELFFAMASFDRVTDRLSGNTSEDEGQLSVQAQGGERTIDIPTRLLWKPQDASFMDVDASVSGLVQSVDAVTSTADADDWRAPTLRVTLSRALRSGERVTFDWEAAVRPPSGS